MTIDEKLRSRSVKQPPGWFYTTLMGVTKVLNMMSNTHFVYKARPSEEPGPIIMIANREARVRFNGKGQMAKRLDTLLYLCPKCGALYRMDCEGNT